MMYWYIIIISKIHVLPYESHILRDSSHYYYYYYYKTNLVIHICLRNYLQLIICRDMVKDFILVPINLASLCTYESKE
jgi:hypothetical protein